MGELGDFSPDGNYILTASRDKTARIFSIASGKEVKSFRLSSWLNSAYFNSNGNEILVSGNDDTVRIIEIASGDEITNFIGTDAKYSPDGNMVITSYHNSTKINYLFQEKKPFELYGTSSVCSNNSNMCLTLSKDSLRIYDLENQTLIKVIKGNTMFKSAAFSPDDKFIATTGVDSLSIIYEFSTGDVFQTLKGHSKQINTISFSRDNKYVLSCSEDNTAKIFDVFSGRELIRLKIKTN